MTDALAERAQAIRESLPAGGLFHEKTWRVSPNPFALPHGLERRLIRLGHQLERFLRACSQLYRMSSDGRQPPWIASLLDRGKPPWLVAIQREKRLRGAIPSVIRPDLILTEDGFVIAELDNVPGGIGLTAWLGRAYTGLGCPVLGGADGMLEGFAEVFPGGDIVVSAEAASYRPEMEWLAAELRAGWARARLARARNRGAHRLVPARLPIF